MADEQDDRIINHETDNQPPVTTDIPPSLRPVCPYCNASPVLFRKYEMTVDNGIAFLFTCVNCSKILPVQVMVLDEPVVRPDAIDLQRRIIRGLT